MKKLYPLILAAAFALPLAAAAQTPPVHPEITTYQQLLSEANDRLAKALAQAQMLNSDLVSTRNRLVEAEKKLNDKAEPKPPAQK